MPQEVHIPERKGMLLAAVMEHVPLAGRHLNIVNINGPLTRIEVLENGTRNLIEEFRIDESGYAYSMQTDWECRL